MSNYHNAVGDKLRDAFNKAKRERDELIQRAKNANAANKKKLQKAIEDAKKKVRMGGKAQLDFNCALNKIPLAVPRLGVLAGARVNFGGMSTRIFPALISEEEAKSRNFNLENRKVALKGWEKVKKIWYNVGGCADLGVLEKAIRDGHNKPVFNTKRARARQEQEKFSSADAGVTEALIVGGVAILTSIIGAIVKSGAAKNPYDGKSLDTTDMYEPTAEELNRMEDIIDDDDVDVSGGESMWKNPWVITAMTVGTIALIFGGYKLYQHLNK